MLNIENTQEDKLKIINPTAQKLLEREKRNKRKSKVFNNLDNVTYFLNNPF